MAKMCVLGTSVADSEARLMNTTYTEAMADRTSAEFRAVAEPFCDEVSVYIRQLR